jgi:hypothetical protein
LIEEKVEDGRGFLVFVEAILVFVLVLLEMASEWRLQVLL